MSFSVRSQFKFRPMFVTMVYPGVREAIRGEFNRCLRKQFRTFALESCSHKPRSLCDYQTHHILPVMFGGANETRNLALVKDTLHVECHQIIREQTDGMRVSESRMIQIPYMTGHLWPRPTL